jgi:muramoyltetrapeptide carboxypeptidase
MSVSPRWPRPLPPGGTIGICSPAGPSPLAAMDRARRALERRGYQVVIAPNARHLHPKRAYLAGTADERLSDLNGLLRDPTVDLVLCARGGYGSMHLLDGIDTDAVRRDPKGLVGYSDITALTLALLTQANVVSFSGTMATAGDGFGENSLDPLSEASFFHAIGDDPFPKVFARLDEDAPWNVLRAPADGSHRVCGPIVPVCLSLLETLMGTPYQPDLTGAVLVIEDVGEALYAVDRALTQLRLAGLLDDLAAVLVGTFNGRGDEDRVLQREVPKLVAELAPARVAVAAGIDYGHIGRRHTLPVGATGTVDLLAGIFTFEATTAML